MEAKDFSSATKQVIKEEHELRRVLLLLAEHANDFVKEKGILSEDAEKDIRHILHDLKQIQKEASSYLPHEIKLLKAGARFLDGLVRNLEQYEQQLKYMNQAEPTPQIKKLQRWRSNVVENINEVISNLDMLAKKSISFYRIIERRIPNNGPKKNELTTSLPPLSLAALKEHAAKQITIHKQLRKDLKEIKEKNLLNEISDLKNMVDTIWDAASKISVTEQTFLNKRLPDLIEVVKRYQAELSGRLRGGITYT